MDDTRTMPEHDPTGSHHEHSEGQPGAGLGHTSSLVGFAGLSALALLLGLSPWSMWPFVFSVALTLCAVMLTTKRSTLVVTVIGIVTGLLWVMIESWRTGIPPFIGWLVPIASYTILVLALHHAILQQAATPRRPGGMPSDAIGAMDRTEVSLPEPAAETAQGFVRAFYVWHRDWADQGEPWPAFDCFLREQLLERVGAKQVRCFRVVAGGNRLLPLSGSTDTPDAPDAWHATWADDGSEPSSADGRVPSWQPRPLASCGGIEGHVVVTGQTFVSGRTDQGDRVNALAARIGDSVVWCFPVKRGEEIIGMVRTGHLPRTSLRNTPLLDLMADLVSLCWARVHDVHELGIARRTDLASGVLARSDFLTVAGHSLTDSLGAHEPAALLVLALEGMRKLDDSAQWTSRDRYIHVVGSVLNARLRTDDVIGRFSDDRFAVLLRRVDAALGKLIANKLHQAVLDALHAEASVSSLHSDSADAAVPDPDGLGVRCALVGGRWSTPIRPETAAPGPAYLHEMIGSAFSLLDAARIRNEDVATQAEEESPRRADEPVAAAHIGEPNPEAVDGGVPSQ